MSKDLKKELVRLGWDSNGKTIGVDLEKFLINKETAENNETLINIIKTDKGIMIDIKGQNVDVKMNGAVIYSNYDNDLYGYIPVEMREFIKKNVEDMGDSPNSKNIYVDIYIDGRDISFYIPYNKSNKITARYSTLYSVEEIKRYIEDLFCDEEKEINKHINKISNMWNKMQEELGELNFELVPSHISEGYWGWGDIFFNSDKWKEESFIKASNIIFDFTKQVEKYVKKIKLE